MKLMFIRHGKAEERGTVEELIRPLTLEGEEKLWKYFPDLQEKLRGHNVEIWISPLKRSRQTGVVLASVLGTERIVVQDFVSNGKIEQMLEALSKVPEGTLPILVGHEPHLSVWTYKLTGEEQYFKKGAVMLLETSGTLGGGSVLDYKTIKNLRDLELDLD